MHGDDSWRENKNTHSLWNKHSFNPFKQAAMSLCHDSSHNNLHRHYPGSVAMASAPSEVATFEGGSLGNVSFLVRSFPVADGMISSWQKSINLSTRIYVKLSAVVQMDRIAAHSCIFYPLVLYDLRYCKHKLRERGVNFKCNLNGNYLCMYVCMYVCILHRSTKYPFNCSLAAETVSPHEHQFDLHI